MIVNNTQAARIIAVSRTAINVNDATTPLVAFRIIRYPSGGGTINTGRSNTVTVATGKIVSPDTDFTDMDQSMNCWCIASAGTINVEVTDYEN
jgi:hypothetical protein